MVTNIWTMWSSGTRSKMIAGTVNGSSPNRSMSACSASRRCWPSIALRHLQPAHPRTALGRLEVELLVARDDDRARNRRQVARLAALLVVLDQLVDLLADDLALVRLLVRRNAALEQIPVDLRLGTTLLLAAKPSLSLILIAQHFEPDELVDVAGREGGLVELHAELLHSNRGYADHLSPSKVSKERDSIVADVGTQRLLPVNVGVYRVRAGAIFSVTDCRIKVYPK
jgi:hypothetical protein